MAVLVARGFAPTLSTAERDDGTASRAVGIGAGAVLWGYANPEMLLAMNPNATFASPQEVVDYLT